MSLNPASLRTRLIVGLVALVLAFSAGWKVNGWRYNSLKLIAKEAAEESAHISAKAIAGLEIKYVTIKGKTETIVREVPVYTECRHDPDAFRLLNNALSGSSVDRSELSGVGTAER